MGHRWARWTLLVVAIAAAVAACGWALDLEQRLRDVRAAIGTVEARASTARVAMNDVRRALAAMSTPGQAAVGWSRRASSAIDEARAQMAALPPVNAPAAGVTASGLGRGSGARRNAARSSAPSAPPIAAT